MGSAVNHLRVHALPPFALPIGNRLHAVVRNSREWSGNVALVAHGQKLVPHAAWRPVIADAKSQPVRTRHLGPGLYDVALGTYIHAVPGLVFRIPAIEVVMVRGQRNKVFGSRALIKLHKSFRVPSLGFPKMADVLESELRRMSIRLYMVVILTRSLNIHASRVPIALLR